MYNDELTIGVIDLCKIELATEEDNPYKIDCWARLFKAKTWENLKLLAQRSSMGHETLKGSKGGTETIRREQSIDY